MHRKFLALRSHHYASAKENRADRHWRERAMVFMGCGQPNEPTVSSAPVALPLLTERRDGPAFSEVPCRCSELWKQGRGRSAKFPTGAQNGAGARERSELCYSAFAKAGVTGPKRVGPLRLHAATASGVYKWAERR